MRLERTNNKGQIANSKYQTTNMKQKIMENEKQTTNNKVQTITFLYKQETKDTRLKVLNLN